jgi:hypothetical protein
MREQDQSQTLRLFYRLAPDAQRRRIVQISAGGRMLSVKLTPQSRAAMARRRAKAGTSATGPRGLKRRKPRFVVCVRNDSNPAALRLRKTYEVIPDGKAAANHLIRVVDELGEDYLYPENYFVAAKKPDLPRR